MKSELCDYGCGQLAKFYSETNDKYRCSEHQSSCPALSKIRAETRKKKSTSDELIELLIEDYQNGISSPKLEEKYNLGADVILRRLKENGIIIPWGNTGRSFNFSENEIQEILYSYVDMKLSLSQLYKKFDSGERGIRPAIIKILKNAGVLRHKNSKIIVPEEDIKIITILYNQKINVTKISIQTGYSEWVIHKLVKEISIYEPKIPLSSKFDLYKAEVRRFTEQNYKNFQDIINPLNLNRGKFEYHLDHIFSIHDGFVNSIESKIISCVPNLRMIHYKENILKKDRSDIPIDELYRRYNSLD